jgi:hypothetical protein
VHLCEHFFVAAVPQLFFYMRLCRMKNIFAAAHNHIFAALPQNKDRIKMHFDATLIKFG